MRTALLSIFAFTALVLSACDAGSMSCQSGPKYGTQCTNTGQQVVSQSSESSRPSPQTATSPMPASSR